MDTEKESELKYYEQRTNYLEGGIMITGKAPSKTERKKTSRKQLAATRKQLMSEVNELSKQTVVSSSSKRVLPDSTGADSSTVEESETDRKSESLRRIEAMQRLVETTAGKEGTPAKRGRRSKKAPLRVIWNWKENLKELLPGCEVFENERLSEMTVTLQNAAEQESCFCCVLNDGSVSYQVFNDS